MSVNSATPPKTKPLARKRGPRFAALFLLLALLGGISARADTPLILAAPEGRPNTYVENGVVTGFFTDLIIEAFRRQHRTVEIRIMPWLRCIEETKTGHVDGMYIIYKIPEREPYFDYPVEPLALLHEMAFVRTGPHPISRFDPEQASGRRVAIVSHSHHGKMLDDALRSERFQVQEIDGYHNLVNMLAAGRIDVAIAVHDPMQETIDKLGLQGKITRLHPDLDRVPSYLTFTKVRDMSAARHAFDDGIRSMKADGTYDAIARKYGMDERR
jgi:polar amino acid transport system substrate-binding protein